MNRTRNLLNTKSISIGILIVEFLGLLITQDSIYLWGVCYAGMMCIWILPKYCVLPFLQILIEMMNSMLHTSGILNVIQRFSNVSNILNVFFWIPIFIVPKSAALLYGELIFGTLGALFLRCVESEVEYPEKSKISFWIAWTMCTLFSGICAALVIITPAQQHELFISIEQWNTRMIILAFLIGVCIALGFLARFYEKQKVEQQAQIEALSLQYELRQSEIYVQLLKEKNDILQGYQHDHKKHLNFIYGLAKSQRYDQIEEYTKSLFDAIESDEKDIIITGNRDVDLILREKKKTGRDNGVNVTVKPIPGNYLSAVRAKDWVVILGNLLDNSIRAAKDSQGKLVACEFEAVNPYFYGVHIWNDSTIQPNMKDGVPIRDNKEGESGYGIRNCIKCAQNYGGDAEFWFDEENRIFHAKILLPVEKGGEG